MIFSNDQPKPKFRKLWNQIAVQYKTSTYIINTKGLVSMQIIDVLQSSANGSDNYELIANYGGANCVVAAFDDADVARTVQLRIFKSIGAINNAFRKAAFFAISVIFIMLVIGTFTGKSNAYSGQVATNSAYLTQGGIVLPVPNNSSEIEKAKAELREKIKAEAGNVQDFVPKNYTFSPKIVTPPLEVPELKCLSNPSAQITLKK